MGMGVSNRTNCNPKKPNLLKSVRTRLTSLLTKMITVYLGLLALIALARPVESDLEEKPLMDVYLNDLRFVEQEAARQAAQEAAQESAQEDASQPMESATCKSESSESASESFVA